TTAASPSPSPSPTSSPVTGSPVKGYDGKCLDDNGNSSANDTKIQIWTCYGGKPQLWTYNSGELVHNGKCLNDDAWGGIRTKQILYTCNRALNELWTHLSNGEFVLNAKGYKLCLDDPAYSTKNGTQLIVYTCKDSSNQRWTLPTVVP
ncbi:MAG: RICIN domain-containing protein, partial [Streptosporangiaceae bacterium]